MEKTCGNCGRSKPSNTVFCDRIGREVGADDSAVNGDCWQPSDLEQRCQQLEQVAREMYRALTFCTGGCAGGCPMLDDGCSVDSGALRSKLEALGVSLDAQ